MDDKISVAQKIRRTIRELFGSRLVEHLEAEKFLQQSLYEARILERDQEIDRLRQELATLRGKFSEYELDPSYFWWLSQRGRSSPAPPSDSHSVSEVSAPKTWRQIQDEWYAAQETPEETTNGVSDPGRSESVRQ